LEDIFCVFSKNLASLMVLQELLELLLRVPPHTALVLDRHAHTRCSCPSVTVPQSTLRFDSRECLLGALELGLALASFHIWQHVSVSI
jgi:hypothetical protein